MNGLIDLEGGLHIQRGSRMGRQFCRFAPMRDEWCSDECPLFGEPHILAKGAELELCHAVLRFEEFTDERSLDEPDIMSLDNGGK